MAGVPDEAQERRAPLRPWPGWLLLGLTVFVLALLLPPSGDDWRRIDFADHTFSGYLDRVRRFYLEHNGRVLPNVLSFMVIDPVWLRALAKAVTLVGLVAALQRAVGSRTAWGVLPAVLGVLLLPAPVFRQAIAWSTGFFYYVPPLIGVVLLVGTLAGRWPGQRVAGRWWVMPGTALLAAATCLFMEPVTVAALGLAVGGLLVTLLRRRRPSGALVGWAVGTLAGTAMMLASPGLRHSLSGGSDYYGAPGDTLVLTAVTNYALVSRSFVLTSVTVLGLLLLACLAHGGRALRRGRPVAGGLLVAGALLVGGYAVTRRLLRGEPPACGDGSLSSCNLSGLALDLTMLVLLLVLVAGTGLLATDPALTGEADRPGFTRAGRDRAAWVALLAATLLMLAPLLVVQPIGGRNLYGPLVMLTGTAMLALRPWVDGDVGAGGIGAGGVGDVGAGGARAGDAGARRGVLVVRTGLATVAAAALVQVGVVSWANAQVFAERVRLLEEAVAEDRDEVELPPYPDGRWVHVPDDDLLGYHYYVDRRHDIVLRFRQADP